MEKVLGPFHGYYAAIRVLPSGAKFSASYKICTSPATDYGRAIPLRHRRVGGVWDSVEEAFDIAEQLARLLIAGLGVPDSGGLRSANGAAAAQSESAGSGHPGSEGEPSLYAATEPCPLYPPRAPAGRLYAPTEPAPLFPMRG
jgi:hypothetical protein